MNHSQNRRQGHDRLHRKVAHPLIMYQGQSISQKGRRYHQRIPDGLSKEQTLPDPIQQPTFHQCPTLHGTKCGTGHVETYQAEIYHPDIRGKEESHGGEPYPKREPTSSGWRQDWPGMRSTSVRPHRCGRRVCGVLHVRSGGVGCARRPCSCAYNGKIESRKEVVFRLRDLIDVP